MRYSFVLILCLSAPANAQERGWYLGGSAGSYRFEDHDVSVSDNALSYGLFGGYRISQSFAVEGSLGKTTDFEEILDALFFPNSSTHAKYSVQTVRALGIAQRDKWGLFGGLGYHHSDADASVRVNGVVTDLDSSDRGTTAVIGVQNDSKSLSYRFQYEWFDASKRLDLSNFAFGLLIRF
jgi:outer membrane protein with beta-barrel domain